MRWKILMCLLMAKSIDEELLLTVDYVVDENRVCRKRQGASKDLANKERMKLSELARVTRHRVA